MVYEYNQVFKGSAPGSFSSTSTAKSDNEGSRAPINRMTSPGRVISLSSGGQFRPVANQQCIFIGILNGLDNNIRSDIPVYCSTGIIHIRHNKMILLPQNFSYSFGKLFMHKPQRSETMGLEPGEYPRCLSAGMP